MHLRRATDTDVTELMSWFDNSRSCKQWGGPSFEFPFTRETFVRDLHWPDMDSFGLVDELGQLTGFGQFYEKYSRVHLARIVVSKNSRGAGNGAKLVQGLAEAGMERLSHKEASLYVYKDNEVAIACYEKVGFVKSGDPAGDEKFDDCFFMVFKPGGN